MALVASSSRISLLAAAADAVAVVVFAAVGRLSHGEPDDLLGLVVTAAPFGVGLVAAWATPVVRREPAAWKAGFVTLVCVAVIGLLIAGATLGTAASPLGPYRAAGSVLLLGRLLEGGKALQAQIDRLGCVSGMSALPNGAGTGIRLLAPDGGRLSLALALATQACFRAASGVDPAPRRK